MDYTLFKPAKCDNCDYVAKEKITLVYNKDKEGTGQGWICNNCAEELICEQKKEISALRLIIQDFGYSDEQTNGFADLARKYENLKIDYELENNWRKILWNHWLKHKDMKLFGANAKPVGV